MLTCVSLSLHILSPVFAMDYMHSSRVQRLVLWVWALSCICSARVEGATGFVAFNDYVSGLGTGSNVTTYQPGQGGALKNVSNGANLGATVTVTGLGQTTGAVQGRPDYGSPA